MHNNTVIYHYKATYFDWAFIKLGIGPHRKTIEIAEARRAHGNLFLYKGRELIQTVDKDNPTQTAYHS